MSTELLENEISLLRMAIVGIADEANISFCYGCHNWGKSYEFTVAQCVGCGEWECNECGTVHKIIHENLCLQLCNGCFTSVSKKYTILTLYDGDKPVCHGDNDELFIKTDFMYDTMDTLDDAYSGSHYDYHLRLIGVGRGPENEIILGIGFVLEEGYEDDGVSVEELRDELVCCLSEIDINPPDVTETDLTLK